jgi:hypothetical protein
LTDDVSDAEVLRSTLAIRHWLRQTVRLDSIPFCGAIDVRCDAGGSIFTPDFLVFPLSARALCPSSVPLLSAGSDYCKLYVGYIGPLSYIMYAQKATAPLFSARSSRRGVRTPAASRPSPGRWYTTVEDALLVSGLDDCAPYSCLLRGRGISDERSSGVRTCTYGRQAKH